MRWLQCRASHIVDNGSATPHADTLAFFSGCCWRCCSTHVRKSCAATFFALKLPFLEIWPTDLPMLVRSAWKDWRGILWEHSARNVNDILRHRAERWQSVSPWKPPRPRIRPAKSKPEENMSQKSRRQAFRSTDNIGGGLL